MDLFILAKIKRRTLTFLPHKVHISCWRYRIRYSNLIQKTVWTISFYFFFVLVFVNWMIETNRVWHDTLARRNCHCIRRFCCIELMLEDIANHRRIGIGQRRMETLLLWQRRFVMRKIYPLGWGLDSKICR